MAGQSDYYAWIDRLRQLGVEIRDPETASVDATWRPYYVQGLSPEQAIAARAGAPALSTSLPA